MSVRRRLLLSLILTAVPLVAAAVWLRIQVDRWAGEQAFRDLAAARVEEPDALGRQIAENAQKLFGDRF